MTPTRRLTDRHNPAPYTPASHTDIRATFARARESTMRIDDHDKLRDMRERHWRGVTLAPSAQAMATINREASSLRLVSSPAPLDSLPFMAPPPRRGHPSIPRSGPARIAARTERERRITRVLAWTTAALGLVLLTWTLIPGGAA